MKNKKLVLIDTHGVSQNDKHELSSLINMLEYTKTPIQVYLALPCQQQEEVVEDIIREFNLKRVVGCILMKMDESNTINPVSSLAIRYQLPMAYACYGQDVNKDIRFPNKAYIVTKMMSMQETIIEKQSKHASVKHFHEPVGLVGQEIFNDKNNCSDRR
jgi:flagellar biosynthesis GTPase FlhF